MENMMELLVAIPIIFSYFIPGYIYLWVRKQINNGKMKSNMELLLLCIVITFLLNLIIETVLNIFNLTSIMKKTIGINGAYTCGNLISVVFAIICGYLSCNLKNMKVVLWLKRILKINGSAYTTVWNAVLTEPAWVTVYLEHLNICYVGRARYVLTDPEVDRRELYLTQYVAYDMNNDMKILVDNKNSIQNGVYIDCKNVERIEVLDDNSRAEFITND